MTEEVKALIIQGEVQTQIVLKNYLESCIPSNLSTLSMKNQSEKLNNQLKEGK